MGVRRLARMGVRRSASAPVLPFHPGLEVCAAAALRHQKLVQGHPLMATLGIVVAELHAGDRRGTDQRGHLLHLPAQGAAAARGKQGPALARGEYSPQPIHLLASFPGPPIPVDSGSSPTHTWPSARATRIGVGTRFTLGRGCSRFIPTPTHHRRQLLVLPCSLPASPVITCSQPFFIPGPLWVRGWG